MPELPDIDTYCHALRARVLGQPLARFELLSPFVLRTVTPAPSSAEGRVVTRVQRLGKRVVLTFEPDLHFVVHLMIAGRLRFEPTVAGGKPQKPLSPRAGALFALHFPSGRLTLGEVSKKKRAKLHVVTGETALREHDPGGVEPLEVDLAGFRAALTAENHTIKRALTDPRVLSGIGKYGQPCPVCAEPIQRIRYADNETNYCARCQNGGVLLADRGLSRLLRGDWPKTLEGLEELKRARSV